MEVNKQEDDSGFTDFRYQEVRYSSLQMHWIKPPENYLTFNSDTRYINNLASIDMVARKRFEDILRIWEKMLNADLAEEAETRALSLVIGLAAAISLPNVIFECNCQNIIIIFRVGIMMCLGNQNNSWKKSPYISEDF